MKIVLFSTGFREYMICLANALSKEAEVSLVIGNRGLTSMHRDLIAPDVKVFPFSYVDYKSLRQNSKMLYGLGRRFRRQKPDILHIQSNGFPHFWLLYPFLRATTIVNTIHDPTPHSGDQLSLESPRKTCRNQALQGILCARRALA